MSVPLGEKIKSERQDRGLTQEELGQELDLDATTISKIETGKAKPSLDTLYKIANKFGLSASELLENADVKIT